MGYSSVPWAFPWPYGRVQNTEHLYMPLAFLEVFEAGSGGPHYGRSPAWPLTDHLSYTQANSEIGPLLSLKTVTFQVHPSFLCSGGWCCWKVSRCQQEYCDYGFK